MEKVRPKIQVVDIESNQVLYECSIEEAEKAYQFAAHMEEMGLNLKVRVPTLSDTLSNALGLSPEAKRDYQESLAEEIENHDGSCCFENSDKKAIH